MQKWEYCGIQMADGGLFAFNLKADQEIEFSPLPEDLSAYRDQGNPSHTIRRWTAALGLRGWELVSIITLKEGNYQEWMFKRPIELDPLSSLWKEETS